MKKLAALLLLVAACGPGLVEHPLAQSGANTTPKTPADCAATAGLVLCGTQCATLGPTNCGLNNGVCEDCTATHPGQAFSCSSGVCTPPTTCPGRIVGVGGCADPTQVVAGGNTSCAIVTQAPSTGVYCWGANDTGQLGPGPDPTVTSSSSPFEIPSLRGATAVALGTGHGCAIVGGSVLCWGRNDAGQLGSNATASVSSTPVAVPDVSGATAIAAGDRHSCAVTANGVVCWGATDFKQLGVDTPGLAVPGTIGATKVVAGLNHTCAQLPSSVVCWGANDSGQIGNGTPSGGVAPFKVPLTGDTPPPADLATIDLAAGSNHTCALISGTGIDFTNALRCWGSNGSSQILSDGVAIHASPVPRQAFNSKTPSDHVAAGRAHTCALRSPTDLFCFGDNSSGQTTPPVTTFTSISAGGDHNCLLDSANEIHCFGRNLSSELGAFGP